MGVMGGMLKFHVGSFPKQKWRSSATTAKSRSPTLYFESKRGELVGRTAQIAGVSSHSSTDTDRNALVRLVEKKEGVGPALSYAPPPGDATGQTDPDTVTP